MDDFRAVEETVVFNREKTTTESRRGGGQERGEGSDEVFTCGRAGQKGLVRR